MRTLAFAFTILLALPVAAADQYTVDKTHSDVSFEVRHLLSKVPGRFNDFNGTFALDKAKPAQSTVKFSIASASVDTNLADRDAHLRNEDFFDSAKYPTIDFISTSVRPRGNGRFDVTGNLTLRGITRKVTLPVLFVGFIKDPWGNEKAGFETELTINRKDFGMEWNKTLDNGGVLLGENVKVRFNLELNKAK